jgi:hypothetical protein
VLTVDDEAWDDFMGDDQFPNISLYVDDIAKVKEAHHLKIKTILGEIHHLQERPTEPEFPLKR